MYILDLSCITENVTPEDNQDCRKLINESDIGVSGKVQCEKWHILGGEYGKTDTCILCRY